MALFRSVAAVAAKRLLRSNQFTTTTARMVTPFNTLKTLGSISDVLVQKRGIHTTVAHSSEEEEEEEEEENPEFQKMRELVLDHPVLGDPADCLIRNLMRMFFNERLSECSSCKSLLGNTYTLIQLVLIDPNRYIQGCRHKFTRGDIDDTPDAAERCRNAFKVVAPCLLHAYDTDFWVFSRSLVFTKHRLINEALEFTTHDPVGGLKDVQLELPPGTSVYQCEDKGNLDKEKQKLLLELQVHKNFNSSLEKAVKEFRYELFERPFIRCTEAFLVIVGEYAIEDGGLNSREGVQKLLHELNSKEGLAKVHAFEAVCGSAKVNPEILSVIKGVHLTA